MTKETTDTVELKSFILLGQIKKRDTVYVISYDRLTLTSFGVKGLSHASLPGAESILLLEDLHTDEELYVAITKEEEAQTYCSTISLIGDKVFTDEETARENLVSYCKKQAYKYSSRATVLECKL